jgi:Cytochrome C'
MRVIGIFLAAGLAMAQAPTYEPVANVGQIMQGIVQPAQKAIQDAAKEQGPQDARAWRAAQVNGIMLQEAAQLLLIGNRAKDTEGWVKAAHAMSEVGAATAKAAEAKDLGALQSAATGMNATCQGCHSVYRPRGGQKKQ